MAPHEATPPEKNVGFSVARPRPSPWGRLDTWSVPNPPGHGVRKAPQRPYGAFTTAEFSWLMGRGEEFWLEGMTPHTMAPFPPPPGRPKPPASEAVPCDPNLLQGGKPCAMREIVEPSMDLEMKFRRDAQSNLAKPTQRDESKTHIQPLSISTSLDVESARTLRKALLSDPPQGNWRRKAVETCRLERDSDAWLELWHRFSLRGSLAEAVSAQFDVPQVYRLWRCLLRPMDATLTLESILCMSYDEASPEAEEKLKMLKQELEEALRDSDSSLAIDVLIAHADDALPGVHARWRQRPLPASGSRMPSVLCINYDAVEVMLRVVVICTEGGGYRALQHWLLVMLCTEAPQWLKAQQRPIIADALKCLRRSSATRLLDAALRSSLRDRHLTDDSLWHDLDGLWVATLAAARAEVRPELLQAARWGIGRLVLESLPEMGAPLSSLVAAADCTSEAKASMAALAAQLELPLREAHAESLWNAIRAALADGGPHDSMLDATVDRLDALRSSFDTELGGIAYASRGRMLSLKPSPTQAAFGLKKKMKASDEEQLMRPTEDKNFLQTEKAAKPAQPAGGAKKHRMAIGGNIANAPALQRVGPSSLRRIERILGERGLTDELDMLRYWSQDDPKGAAKMEKLWQATNALEELRSTSNHFLGLDHLTTTYERASKLLKPDTPLLEEARCWKTSYAILQAALESSSVDRLQQALDHSEQESMHFVVIEKARFRLAELRADLDATKKCAALRQRLETAYRKRTDGIMEVQQALFRCVWEHRVADSEGAFDRLLSEIQQDPVWLVDLAENCWQMYEAAGQRWKRMLEIPDFHAAPGAVRQKDVPDWHKPIRFADEGDRTLLGSRSNGEKDCCQYLWLTACWLEQSFQSKVLAAVNFFNDAEHPTHLGLKSSLWDLSFLPSILPLGTLQPLPPQQKLSHSSSADSNSPTAAAQNADSEAVNVPYHCKVEFSPVRTIEQCLEDLENSDEFGEISGPHAEYILDILRATVTFEDPYALSAFLAFLLESPDMGLEVVRIRNQVKRSFFGNNKALAAFREQARRVPMHRSNDGQQSEHFRGKSTKSTSHDESHDSDENDWNGPNALLEKVLKAAKDTVIVLNVRLTDQMFPGAAGHIAEIRLCLGQFGEVEKAAELWSCLASAGAPEHLLEPLVPMPEISSPLKCEQVRNAAEELPFFERSDFLHHQGVVALAHKQLFCMFAKEAHNPETSSAASSLQHQFLQMRAIFGGQVQILNDALKQYTFLSSSADEDVIEYAAAETFGSSAKSERWRRSIEMLQLSYPPGTIKSTLEARLENHNIAECRADAQWAAADVRRAVRRMVERLQESDLELRFSQLLAMEQESSDPEPMDVSGTGLDSMTSILKTASFSGDLICDNPEALLHLVEFLADQAAQERISRSSAASLIGAAVDQKFGDRKKPAAVLGASGFDEAGVLPVYLRCQNHIFMLRVKLRPHQSLHNLRASLMDLQSKENYRGALTPYPQLLPQPRQYFAELTLSVQLANCFSAAHAVRKTLREEGDWMEIPENELGMLGKQCCDLEEKLNEKMLSEECRLGWHKHILSFAQRLQNLWLLLETIRQQDLAQLGAALISIETHGVVGAGQTVIKFAESLFFRLSAGNLVAAAETPMKPSPIFEDNSQDETGGNAASNMDTISHVLWTAQFTAHAFKSSYEIGEARSESQACALQEIARAAPQKRSSVQSRSTISHGRQSAQGSQGLRKWRATERESVDLPVSKVQSRQDLLKRTRMMRATQGLLSTMEIVQERQSVTLELEDLLTSQCQDLRALQSAVGNAQVLQNAVRNTAGGLAPIRESAEQQLMSQQLAKLIEWKDLVESIMTGISAGLLQLQGDEELSTQQDGMDRLRQAVRDARHANLTNEKVEEASFVLQQWDAQEALESICSLLKLEMVQIEQMQDKESLLDLMLAGERACAQACRLGVPMRSVATAVEQIRCQILLREALTSADAEKISQAQENALALRATELSVAADAAVALLAWRAGGTSWGSLGGPDELVVMMEEARSAGLLSMGGGALLAEMEDSHSRLSHATARLHAAVQLQPLDAFHASAADEEAYAEVRAALAEGEESGAPSDLLKTTKELILDFQAIDEFRSSVLTKDIKRARGALVQTKKRMKNKPTLKNQMLKLEIWVIDERLTEVEGLGDPSDMSDAELVYYVDDLELKSLIWEAEHCLHTDFRGRIGTQRTQRIMELLGEARNEITEQLEECAEGGSEESVMAAAVERAKILKMTHLQAAKTVEQLLERIRYLRAYLTEFLAASAVQSQSQVKEVWELLGEAEKIGLDQNLLRQASRRARRMLKPMESDKDKRSATKDKDGESQGEELASRSVGTAAFVAKTGRRVGVAVDLKKMDTKALGKPT